MLLWILFVCCFVLELQITLPFLYELKEIRGIDLSGHYWIQPSCTYSNASTQTLYQWNETFIWNLLMLPITKKAQRCYHLLPHTLHHTADLCLINYPGTLALFVILAKIGLWQLWWMTEQAQSTSLWSRKPGSGQGGRGLGPLRTCWAREGWIWPFSEPRENTETPPGIERAPHECEYDRSEMRHKIPDDSVVRVFSIYSCRFGFLLGTPCLSTLTLAGVI